MCHAYIACYYYNDVKDCIDTEMMTATRSHIEYCQQRVERDDEFGWSLCCTLLDDASRRLMHDRVIEAMQYIPF